MLQGMLLGTKRRCAFAAAVTVLSVLGSACSDDAAEPVTDAGASHDAARADAAAGDAASSTDGGCKSGTSGATCFDGGSDAGEVVGADGAVDSAVDGALDAATDVDAGTDGGAGNGDAGVTPTIVINEVESNGGNDWTELFNPGTQPVDVSGWAFKDNDDSRNFRLSPGTVIAPGGYLVLDEGLTGFALGVADSVRLYAANGVTLVDSYSWTAHAGSTYGRCPNGSGEFKDTLTSKGVVNQCPDPDAGAPWPGPSTVVEVDALNDFSSNLSGLVYQAGDVPANSVLWAVRNDPSTLYRLQTDGTLWTSSSSGGWMSGKRFFYPTGTGNPDAEGVTLVPGSTSPLLYMATERDGGGSSRLSILQVDPSPAGGTLTAQHEWNLTADLPAVDPNSGLEGIAFVSDLELSAQAFREGDGQPYNPARFADHGGGVFLVGVEGTGNIHVYALNHADDSFLRLATFSSGLPAVMDLAYDPDTNYLWAYGDNTVGNLAVLFEIEPNMASLSYGKFVQRSVFKRPSGMPNINNEGITFAPESECAAGVRAFFWSDDSPANGHALRRGGIPCGRAY